MYAVTNKRSGLNDTVDLVEGIVFHTRMGNVKYRDFTLGKVSPTGGLRKARLTSSLGNALARFLVERGLAWQVGDSRRHHYESEKPSWQLHNLHFECEELPG